MQAVVTLTMEMRMRLFVRKLEVKWSTVEMRRYHLLVRDLKAKDLVLIVG
jgi:hypothetical protein